MTSKTSLLASAGICIVCFLSAAGPSQAAPKHKHPVAAANSQLADEVKALKEQVEALQATVQAQAQSQQQTQAQVAASQAQAEQATATAHAAQAKLDAQIEQIPGTVQTVVAAQPAPTLDKLKYKGITLTLGGFAEAAGIYRSKTLESDISSPFAKIPFENSGLSKLHELRGTARQSRVQFLAQGDINVATHAAFFGEFDFQGAAQTANSNESNSYNPRIRNLYGTMDWDYWGLHLLAGQNWSLVTLNSKGITPRNEVPPPSIDAQYVPGFSWTRTPQLRLTKDFADKQFWLAVSLENPQSTFTGTSGSGLPGGVSVLDLATGNATINPAPTATSGFGGFNAVNTTSFNKTPDVILKGAWEPYIGVARPLHIEAFGIYRDFYDQITVSPTNTQGLTPGVHEASVSGGGWGAGITYNAIPKILDLQASVMSGKGIGRYGAGQLADATLDVTGKVAPIQETMYLVGGTLHVTPEVDLYLFGGDERQNSRISTFGNANFGFGNLNNTVFTAAGCTTVGGACSATVRDVGQITAGLWDKAYTGSFGQIRIGLQYSHTRLEGFSGGGYTPKTSDDMIFTSFRYYPF
jgi:cell division septum initiation protein DivIVA